MTSQYMLSNDEYLYITSQKSKLPKTSNIPQMRMRIKNKVNRAFKTFELLQESDKILQQYKDELFLSDKINPFLRNLTKYDNTAPIADEENKQSIAKDLLFTGIQYFQARYKKPRILFDEFYKVHKIIEELQEMSRQSVSENEAMLLYKLRHGMPSPPLISGSKLYWTALCIHCYNYASGDSKEESLKNLRHEKRCSYSKEFKRLKNIDKNRVIEQYIKFVPPKGNKK